ncbi:hypothetical protein BC567DRAFT_238296 [Phyllosticta citribraziliensis]
MQRVRGSKTACHPFSSIQSSQFLFFRRAYPTLSTHPNLSTPPTGQVSIPFRSIPSHGIAWHRISKSRKTERKREKDASSTIPYHTASSAGTASSIPQHNQSASQAVGRKTESSPSIHSTIQSVDHPFSRPFSRPPVDKTKTQKGKCEKTEKGSCSFYSPWCSSSGSGGWAASSTDEEPRKPANPPIPRIP